MSGGLGETSLPHPNPSPEGGGLKKWLFALVERAAEGRLGLGEMVALFWHCLKEPTEGLTREAFGEGVVAGGLAAATPALRVLIGQILAGR